MTHPTRWTNQFFRNLLKYDWEVHVGPGGHHQWRPQHKPTATAAIKAEPLPEIMSKLLCFMDDTLHLYCAVMGQLMRATLSVSAAQLSCSSSGGWYWLLAVLMQYACCSLLVLLLLSCCVAAVLTTDVALLHDPSYLHWVKTYAENEDTLRHAFKHGE